MRAVRNLLLCNQSRSQLCSWLCPEPGWDAKLLQRRYKTGGGRTAYAPTDKSRWHSNTNAALKHWKKRNAACSESQKHSPLALGLLLHLLLPCPSTLCLRDRSDRSTLHPGDQQQLRCCSAAWGSASDLLRLCPGLDQLLPCRGLMDVAQIPLLLTGCSFSYCKNILYFYPEGCQGELRAEAHNKDTLVSS